MLAKLVACFLPHANGWVRRIAPYLLFYIVTLNKSWIGDENPLLLFPFFIAIFLLCYGGPWYARLTVGVIFFSLLESICMMLDTIEHLLLNHYINETVLASLKLVVWLAMFLICQHMTRKAGIFPLPKHLWALLGGLAAAPLFTVLSFAIWGYHMLGDITSLPVSVSLAYTILPFTALSAFALLVAIVALSRHEMLEQRNKLAEMQEVYYQSLQREQNGVRTLRHDLHNHIAAVQALMANDNYAEATQYLDALSKSPELTDGKQYCENKIAAAVLSSKVPLAEQKGVHFDIKVDLPDPLGLPDIELCALLGNALDNAIEAAETAKDRRIAIRARADKGMLMLRVENTFSQMPTQQNGTLLTNKKNFAAHGYGFAGMQEIARRHGGMCEGAYTKQEFRLLVSVPLAL